MAKQFTGGASFGFSLDYNTAVPVDTRFVVATITDLKDPKTWVSGTYNTSDDTKNVYVVYQGLNVVVNSEKTIYIYSSTTINGEEISKESSWTKLASSVDTSSAAVDLSKVRDAVGLNSDYTHKTTSGNYTSGASTIAGEIDALDTALKSESTHIQTVDDDLVAEIAKFTASKTIEEKSGSYETALTIGIIDASGDTPAQLALKDKEGTTVSSFDISKIVGSGSLKESSYNKDTGILTLTFNTADGKGTSHQIDLKAMLDINDILIDEDSQDYLEVDLSESTGQATFSAVIGTISTGTKGLADASEVKTYVEGKISGLDKASTTAKGTNVEVKYKEDDGIVTIESITESYASVSTDDEVTVGNKTGLVTGSDLESVVEYFEDKLETIDVSSSITAEINKLDANITSTGGTNVSVNIVEEDGKLKSATVTETYANVEDSDGILITNENGLVTGEDLQKVVDYVDEAAVGAIEELDTTVDSADTNNIKVSITQEDGLLTSATITEKYATVAKGTGGQITVTNESQLIQGKDLITLNSAVGDQISAAVSDLDSSATSTDGTYLEVSVTATSGKITEVSVEETYGEFADTITKDGIAKVSTTKAYVDSLFEWVEL